MSALLLILVVLLALAVAGGGWAHPRYGWPGWSPTFAIVLIILVLWLLGGFDVDVRR